MNENKQPLHKYNEQKKVEKVVSEEVKTKRKGVGKRLADIFLSEDAANVKSYIFTDVVIPAVKDTIVDIVKSGIEMLFYGETRANKTTKSGGGTYVSYSNYYNTSSRNRQIDTGDRNRNWRDSREFIFASRGDAEKVLIDLTAIIDDYQAASVADLCSLVGITGEWTDNKFGWVDLSGSKVRKVYGGWIIDLPKPIYLE